jgi:hypothetical protein
MRSKNRVDERLIKYQHMLRRRRLLYLCFLPTGLVLMLLLRAAGSPSISALSWPMLVIYIVAFVFFIRRNDLCPWCGKTFSTNEQSDSHSVGFDALFRKQCANCGQPENLN